MGKVAAERYETMGQVLEHLGVPASRILVRPSPGDATEADLLAVRKKNRLCELVDGVLVEKPMGTGESALAGWLILNLSAYLLQKDTGFILTADGFLRILPAVVRAPDISFIRWSKLPNRNLPTQAILELAPDLAVEILSASNTEEEMQQKLREYFLAGTEVVWFVDPVRRVIVVHAAVGSETTLSEGDILPGDPVLPGLNLPVSKIFEKLPPPPRKNRSLRKQ